MKKILFILLAIGVIVFNLFLVKGSIKGILNTNEPKQNTASVFDVVKNNLNLK